MTNKEWHEKEHEPIMDCDFRKIEMSDKDKIVKGLSVCSEHGALAGEDCHGHYAYTDNLQEIIKANDYSWKCPYNGCKTGCVKTLVKDILALLKEQERIIKQYQKADGFLFAHGWKWKVGEVNE